MRRIILLATLLAVTVAGCNRFPDLTIQITANLAPDDSTCGVTPEQEERVARGVYDLAIVRSYVFTPRIESYLIDNSLETQAPQTNIQITSMDVTIKLPDGTKPTLSDDLPNPYNVTTNTVIPPSQSIGDVSAGTALALAIPSSYHGALVDILDSSGFDSIVMKVRANGVTSGGFHQSSPTFSWPIELCVGCLGVECPDGSEIGDPANGCYTGQDNWTYCASIAAPDTAP